jgi:hypothetical protein
MKLTKTRPQVHFVASADPMNLFARAPAARNVLFPRSWPPFSLPYSTESHLKRQRQHHANQAV